MAVAEAKQDPTRLLPLAVAATPLDQVVATVETTRPVRVFTARFDRFPGEPWSRRNR